jgi:hypothetical protein
MKGIAMLSNEETLLVEKPRFSKNKTPVRKFFFSLTIFFKIV